MSTTTTDGRIHLEPHPAAALFPMLSGDELAQLRANISDRKAQGLKPLLHDIVLDKPLDEGGRVLDGRNRLLACNMTGVEPTFTVYQGDDPIGFVIAANIHRRHLSASQRAAIAADLLPMYEAEAAARRAKGAEAGRAAQAKAALTADEGEVEPLDGEADAGAEATDEKPAQPVRARDQAAAVMNVSARSVESAANVREKGAPELVGAVKRGEVSVSTAEALTARPPAEQAAVVARGPKAAKAEAARIRAEEEAKRRTERDARIVAQSAGNAPLVGVNGKLYGVALIDPPWRYDAPISDSRRIENQYPTMSIEDLCALPVASLLTSDAIVFMWVTGPHDVSGEAQKLVEAWGLKLVSKTIWVKDTEAAVTERGGGSRAGMGRWQRVDHELVYWCVRGTPPTPATPVRPSSVIYRPRGKHSEKPDVVAELIERIYPGLPKLELFARGPRAGWDVWGNESAGKVAAPEVAA